MPKALLPIVSVHAAAAVVAVVGAIARTVIVRPKPLCTMPTRPLERTTDRHPTTKPTTSRKFLALATSRRRHMLLNRVANAPAASPVPVATIAPGPKEITAAKIVAIKIAGIRPQKVKIGPSVPTVPTVLSAPNARSASHGRITTPVAIAIIAAMRHHTPPSALSVTNAQPAQSVKNAQNVKSAQSIATSVPSAQPTANPAKSRAMSLVRSAPTTA